MIVRAACKKFSLSFVETCLVLEQQGLIQVVTTHGEEENSQKTADERNPSAFR